MAAVPWIFRRYGLRTLLLLLLVMTLVAVG
jgi:hypothetical protein